MPADLPSHGRFRRVELISRLVETPQDEMSLRVDDRECLHAAGLNDHVGFVAGSGVRRIASAAAAFVVAVNEGDPPR